ncbi:transmembrane protein 141 isoform X2 [Peromyscus californicus insignis]|uniref:transmembrane protein 141 isoform X2 n=1 Tax=Peromyscus californicus insignis TaxID=564181 RepID=UPI0022A802E3|nr:transmembrane protein 141 isoform X2 [Peromyscus californicus insignis]
MNTTTLIPGSRGICRVPVERLHEGRFHPCHRRWRQVILPALQGAVVTKTITLQADQWFLGSWQALVRLLACSCSLSGSFHTLCSGASWWLPL